MAETDHLSNPEQLRQDADVLEAWADCVGSNRLEIVRRAAAALRQAARLGEISHRFEQRRKSYVDDLLSHRGPSESRSFTIRS